MPRRFHRICPFCGRPNLQNLSTHLSQVHGLSSVERKPYLKQAHVSSWHPYIGKPNINIDRSFPTTEKRRITQPAKKPKPTSLTTKPCPHFNFRHKFSLLVVGPTQSGKTYFVQQMLEQKRIVYEEKKRIRIFWYYNQWQDRYDDLKKSLGKSIRFERGLPELSDDLSEIDPQYNNVIILDDLMAEATDSPMVARLFTQGRHRNASVILLLQNMFPKGKFNTDISRNAQYLALFRSPSDRKQIGIVGERMFDKNRDQFMAAYYKETKKPFGYLLVDNKPDTPADKQVLGDVFGDCHVYPIATPTEKRISDAEPTTAVRPGTKQNRTYITWSDATISEWLKYTKGAEYVRAIPKGYAIMEMYTTSRNTKDPTHPGVVFNDEHYWPVKIRHRSSGHIKWVNLHEDEPTVRDFAREALAMKN